MLLAWGAKVSAQFREAVIEIAATLGCDPSHLMACIRFESHLDPAARNHASGATGLIQFTPSTARDLGTTTDALAAMSSEDQLRYVLAYLRPYAGKLATLADCYMAILWPAAVGAPDDYVLFAQGSKAYEQNSALDGDRDGKVTKADAAAPVARALDEGLLPTNAARIDAEPSEASAPSSSRPYNPEQDAGPPPVVTGMGGQMNVDWGNVLKVGVAVASAVNPIAGALLGAFEPLAQQKIAQALSKHTDPQVANAVAGAALDVLQKTTGELNPIKAFAKAMDDQGNLDPTIVKQAQDAALAKLDELAPMLDKIAEYESAAQAATIASQDAASKRSDGENLRPPLAKWIWVAIALLMVLLGAAIVTEIVVRDDHTPQNDLIVLFGTLGTYLLARLGDVYGYAFGGVMKSGAADTTGQIVLNRGTNLAKGAS